ncbi:MAG TPA: LysR family transcriptional regulator [Candidatus Aphodovivens avistercoris]|nr:LysR family transcriptional regulator [Candidatus Aphodovivens avistercoris]
MNMDEVRYFLAIYKDGSMSQAASELFISPQGLSRSLKRFETKLGVRLFVRTAQGMVPTEQATQLKGMFQKMVDAEDEAYRYLADLKHSQRTRYLIGRDSMLGDVICDGARAYSKLHPDSPVEPVMMREPEDRLAKVFLEGGYDYRFLSVELDPLPDLPHAVLTTSNFTPLVNRDSEIGRRGILRADDFRRITVLAEYSSFTWVQILEQRCLKLGFELKLREVDKEYIARLLREPGDYITYIRSFDTKLSLWHDERFIEPEQEEPLVTDVVLQTTHPSLDDELVECIRQSLEGSIYGD